MPGRIRRPTVIGAVLSVASAQAAIHGIRARVIAVVRASSVSNDANAAAVVDAVQGTITAQLHDAGGNRNGVLLAGRTIVHVPPREPARPAPRLAPGQTLSSRGTGRPGPPGRVVDARKSGPSCDRTAPLWGGP